MGHLFLQTSRHLMGESALELLRYPHSRAKSPIAPGFKAQKGQTSSVCIPWSFGYCLCCLGAGYVCHVTLGLAKCSLPLDVCPSVWAMRGHSFTDRQAFSPWPLGFPRDSHCSCWTLPAPLPSQSVNSADLKHILPGASFLTRASQTRDWGLW